MPQSELKSQQPLRLSDWWLSEEKETLLSDLLSHEMIQQQGKPKVGTEMQYRTVMTGRHPVRVRAGSTANANTSLDCAPEPHRTWRDARL